ncbi:KpsF/GutQ family sugar-phosphate isomerase [Gracilibacillus alcaliphilus]|uniref:KpsF/GutQ family sugar-phosphate isomerase n=1 Tax=Gracilibacillus alcaliphilus TaxID=1401441 RepID=UPI001959E293|nr:SIS domain-containing protein [Gracilibacillus alcaliphilus]MBM7675684.1 arabinose-5-phosphate isomerase [Gracilibacillus alcaliphilus]
MSSLEFIRKAIAIEAHAISILLEQVGPDYEPVIDVLNNCKGKVVITGVGKSGHIGKKMAASFASTGTPAFFMHSTEGVHGDLGMIEEHDVVLMISNSGETAEVLSLLPSLKKIGAKKIAITSNGKSTLATACDFSLTYHYEQEADHIGVAPTTSSTIVLVIGDALAVALCEMRRFTKEDFHLYHPGGSLGRQLSQQ